MRAFRQLLGDRPNIQSLSTDSPEEVIVTVPVSRFLHGRAGLRGQTRGGLLFGSVQDRILTLTLATAARWPSLSPADPFLIDRAYLLGASDAVGFAFGGHVDWCGLWLTFADGQLGSSGRPLHWYGQAVRRGLIDDRAVLLLAGFVDGSLDARALIGEVGREPIDLPITLQ